MKILLASILTVLLLLSSNASANDPNTAHGWECELLIRIASGAYIERQKGVPKATALAVADLAMRDRGLTPEQLFGAALMVEYAYLVPRNGQPEMVRGILRHCRTTP